MSEIQATTVRQPGPLARFIDKFHKPLNVDDQVVAGDSISNVSQRLAKEAAQRGRSLSFHFNGKPFTVHPGDTPQQVEKPYDDFLAKAPKEAEAQKVAAQFDRQDRLQQLLDGGMKVVDAPPQGMVFDPHGLIPAGSDFNSNQEPLQLIKPEQVEQLPTGTALHSIDGETVIKGLDKIDDDTRGGFIAYGFLKPSA